MSNENSVSRMPLGHQGSSGRMTANKTLMYFSQIHSCRPHMRNLNQSTQRSDYPEFFVLC